MTNPIKHQAEVNFKKEYFDEKNPHPGETLLKTLDLCFQADIDVPDWAKAKFRECYAKYRNKCGSEPLIMAFNTDQEAGKHKASKLRKEKHLNTVCHTLWHLHINEKMPIDEHLFKKVAKRHKAAYLSASTIKSWFYSDIKPMLDIMGGLHINPEFVKPDF
jgi:hypothetical protein